MSKRAKEAALKAYPEDWEAGYFEDPDEVTDDNEEAREYFQQGYEKAEKETIERAICWLKVHAEDYIVNMTGSYPDAPFDAVIGGKCWDDLKKAMEEE